MCVSSLCCATWKRMAIAAGFPSCNSKSMLLMPLKNVNSVASTIGAPGSADCRRSGPCSGRCLPEIPACHERARRRVASLRSREDGCLARRKPSCPGDSGPRESAIRRPRGLLHPVDGSLKRVGVVTDSVCMRAECLLGEIHRARIVRSNRVERPGVNGTRPEKDGRDESRQRSARAALLLEERFHGARRFRFVKQTGTGCGFTRARISRRWWVRSVRRKIRPRAIARVDRCPPPRWPHRARATNSRGSAP